MDASENSFDIFSAKSRKIMSRENSRNGEHAETDIANKDRSISFEIFNSPLFRCELYG